MMTIHKTADGKITPLNELADGCTLIIMDTPAMEQDEIGVVYSTLPLGIIVTDQHIITVRLKRRRWCGIRNWNNRSANEAKVWA